VAELYPGNLDSDYREKRDLYGEMICIGSFGRKPNNFQIKMSTIRKEFNLW
jgi:hypothetical protein